MITRIGTNVGADYSSVVGSTKSKNDGLKYEVIRTLIEDEKKPIILDFSASWCGPCKKLYPILEVLADKYSDIYFYKIDIGQNDKENLGDLYNISSLPTCLFFCNGEILDKQEGFHPNGSNIVSALAKLLNSISEEEMEDEDILDEINTHLKEQSQSRTKH